MNKNNTLYSYDIPNILEFGDYDIYDPECLYDIKEDGFIATEEIGDFLCEELIESLRFILDESWVEDGNGFKLYFWDKDEMPKHFIFKELFLEEEE